MTGNGIRAERRMALRAVRDMAFRDVPRAVLRKMLPEKFLTRPLADGKSPSVLCICTVSRAFLRREAHRLDRRVIRHQLATMVVDELFDSPPVAEVSPVEVVDWVSLRAHRCGSVYVSSRGRLHFNRFQNPN